MKPSTKQNLKSAVSVAIAVICAAATVLLTVLCLSNFKTGFLYRHAVVLTSATVCVEIIYITFTAVFFLLKKQTVYKFMLTGLVLAAVILFALYIFQVTGLLERIDSVESLRDIIKSTGIWGPIVFILLQALQVFLLPIPGVLTVLAGVLAFDNIFLTCLYSYVGILLGSFVAFFIGRVIGYRAAAWLVGRDSLDKWLARLKGRDRRILTVMFILPLFPDDILCFISGLSSMSWKYYFFMQLISRAISVIVSCFSIDGRIIPYDTPWGIALWIALGIAIIALFVLIYKKGDKIEQWFLRFFHIKSKRTCEQGPKTGSTDNKKTEQWPSDSKAVETNKDENSIESHRNTENFHQ